MRLDVHVGGFQAFVAQPKGNHCDFDSGLQKVHRRGMANDVGRNPLGFERRASWQGASYSLLKDVVGPVSGQRSTPSVGEQDTIATIATLGNPGPPRAGSSGPQWDTAFLAALALEVKQRGRSESEVVLTDSENLRDAGSGIIERQQQGVIALPDLRLGAWRS